MMVQNAGILLEVYLLNKISSCIFYKKTFSWGFDGLMNFSVANSCCHAGRSEVSIWCGATIGAKLSSLLN
jgi:hypothetical protein